MLGIVIKVDKFFTALLVPFWIGSGSFLYPSAIGLIMALSKPWLNEKVILLSFSEQSFIFLLCLFFDKINSPSDAAIALKDSKKKWN